ncbi:MAG: NHLP bacteriocin system secretion protein, partial [Acidaminococcaceae bacterium]|nr:NHLP bacteriocin system secretion protein [Acidaminococcaceae bacterium]
AEGYGLILDSAGVVNVSHTVSGKVTDLYVKTGSRVQKGDLIARMEQPEQSADTRMAQYGTELGTNDRDVQSRVYEFDAKRYLQAARENIYSDYEGIVGEVMVTEGQLVSAGSPVCSIRLTQNRDELQGVFYIGVDKGKRVEPGMTIQLAPNGVDVTQTGSLIGVVKSVSQYPISSEGVEKSLGNSQLAQYVLQKDGGAAVEVKFELVKDKDSESGYLWTSVVGRHKPVTAGSYCTGSVVIERQPPIEKVFYKISQWLRSR